MSEEKKINDLEDAAGDTAEENTSAGTEENTSAGTEEAASTETEEAASAESEEGQAETPEVEINDELEKEVEEETKESRKSKKSRKSGKDEDEDVLVVKRKNTLSTASVIVIIVCTVIVVACVVFVGIQMGWFEGLKPKAKNKMTMEDYSTIEVSSSDVTVDDDEVESYIESILESEAEDEDIEEGETVEEGDTITISYVGYYDEDGEEGEEIEDATADSAEITLGDSGYIDGFDEGLEGHEVGEEDIYLYLTFPDDYDDEDLAGVDVIFVVDIESAYVTIVPELDDEFAQEYSETYFTETLETAEEFEDYTYDYIYTYYLHAAMLDSLQELQTVTSYDEETEEMLMEYSAETLEYYASLYGYDVDDFAALYGYTDAEEYEETEAHSYMDIGMLFDYIIDDLGLSYTDEDVDEALEAYMKLNGYADSYTLDEFKEESGDTWLWLYENVEYKYDLVLETLEDRVVIVDDEEESTSASEDEE